MKKNKKAIVIAGVAVLLVAAIVLVLVKTAGGLDVVGKDSAAAFEAVLNAAPGNVQADEENGGWSLAAPDGSARFIWSQDYSSSPLYDVMLAFEAEPFLNAGLEVSRLPEGYVLSQGKLVVGTKLGSDALAYQGAPTPLAAYEQIVSHYRSAIGYHTALDHYNVSLGGGNMFEWAKNIEENSVTGENQDKDIVFVLNPEPFIEAGVDPEKVEGWVYTTVSMDMDGNAEDVYKFLKPFNLQ
ncbi:MAG: hypothetical protein ACK5L3_08050 [Oscillospiraceae bacterium]